MSIPDWQAAVRGLRFGQPLRFFEILGSTNDEARRLAQAGAPEGTLVLAEAQSAGRGRLGRRWLTPAGGALALSLVLRPALPAPQAMRLTMLAGLAAAEAVEQAAPVRAELKWPNDLLIGGRKAGGLLLEASLSGETLDFAVLGLGLNVNWAPAPEAADFPATSLEAEAGRRVDRAGLLRHLLLRLEALYPDLLASDLVARWSARLAWLGQAVVVREGGAGGRPAPEFFRGKQEAGGAREWGGIAENVDDEGALWLRLPDGARRRFLAGDVRLRPAVDARLKGG